MLRVAAIQLNSTPDIILNLKKSEDLFRKAAIQGAQLIALPENFSLMAESREAILRSARSPGALDSMRTLARKYRVWCLAGSIAVPAGRNHVTNSSFLIDPQGKLRARYDKIHLFDTNVAGDRAYKESETVRAGREVVAPKIGPVRIGMTICYDLRFPELYRALSKKGAELLLIPSAFTARTGETHWDCLTRARAIENLCYVIAPAQTGTHYSGRKTWGHTRIIGPWGEVLSEVSQGEGIALADLDFDKLKQIRREFPNLKHRRM